MENASQALIIAGAILLAILIIAIGMYIYNSAQSTIQDSITNMSTQEIEAFNNQFESYKGKQKGSQISSLIGRLIGNASTYKDEPGKVPSVYFPVVNLNFFMEPPNYPASYDTVGYVENGAEETDLQKYTNLLTEMKNNVENKHEYTVTFGYDAKSGILSDIYIGYTEDTGFEWRE